MSSDMFTQQTSVVLALDICLLTLYVGTGMHCILSVVGPQLQGLSPGHAYLIFDLRRS